MDIAGHALYEYILHFNVNAVRRMSWIIRQEISVTEVFGKKNTNTTAFDSARPIKRRYGESNPDASSFRRWWAVVLRLRLPLVLQLECHRDFL